MVTYDNLISKINRINDDLNEKNFKRELKEEEKKQGYSSRCKVCTHAKVDEIERLRDDGYTYEEIVEELELDLSIMSLSRHFSNHYPNKTRYRLKQEKLMLEKMVTAINQYPFLEAYFNDKPYEYVYDFINVRGYCTDCFRLCEKIPKGTVSNANRVQYANDKAISDILNHYFSRTEEAVPYLVSKDDCLNCRNNSLNDKLNVLENIIARYVLKVEDLESNELLYLLYTRYDDDTGALVDDLKNTVKS